LGGLGLILALGLLLSVGFALSRIARLAHLPSITGYLVAGISFGPAGFGLLPTDSPESRLEVFTHIALMLVAFGIGERFDLRELRAFARTLVQVSAIEIIATFVLVGAGVGISAYVLDLGHPISGARQVVAIGLICASIAVATAPASTLAVMRETKARGPVSKLVLSDVVVNNALSIILFGMMVTAAQVLLGTRGDAGITRILSPLSNTVASLGLGLAVGFACDCIVHRLTGKDEVLVVSLATVLLVGGLASAFGLSSLLAGVAAGFTIVNRDRRDVRAFRALNDFEPPIYGIFFALAGAELRLQGLLAAGILGGVFVIMRAAGKYFGALVGGYTAKMPPLQARLLGLSLLPQAGLAVGLAYLVQQDISLAPIQTIVIDMVMLSVLINEMIGAPLVRFAMVKAGETARPGHKTSQEVTLDETELIKWGKGIGLEPWPQKPLKPPKRINGHVLICVSHPATVRALTRLGTLIAHHYGARPMAVHVARPEEYDYWGKAADEQVIEMFSTAADEAKTLGYKLHTEVELTGDPAAGILRTASDHDARAVMLGYPKVAGSQHPGRIIKDLADGAPCPVIIAMFRRPMIGGRILVPFTELEDVDIVPPLVGALGIVSKHTITLLRLMPPESSEDELRQAEVMTHQVCNTRKMAGTLNIQAVAAESRVHTILEASGDHNLLIMAIRRQGTLSRAFFGSLPQDVAEHVDCNVIFVYG
jgi:Kef-type K+ transport system membrane component KefB/nucleotide-binding universal stress UspA family protein